MNLSTRKAKLSAVICAGIIAMSSGTVCARADAAGELLNVTVIANDDLSAEVDIAGAAEGFVTALYQGSSLSARADVIAPDGQTTCWPLPVGEDAVLSLSGGSGTYQIYIYELTPDDQYAIIFGTTLEAQIADSLKPFTNPNLFADFREDSACAKKARELYDAAGDNAKAFVKSVYDYVISGIVYDEDLAAELPADYIPDPDATFESGTGICLDYASLMTAMLRSCGVPARIHVGNFGAYYHAWVSAAPSATGGAEADTVSWQTYDPTLGASNDASEVQKRLDRHTDYLARYIY